MNHVECPSCHIEVETETYDRDAKSESESVPYWAHAELRLGSRRVKRTFCPECQEDLAIRGE